LIITQITEDGYLRFECVGRIKPEQLLFKRVCINGVFGVIALKAVHLTSKEEREKPVKAEQLLIDIGADSRKEAEAFITLGDYGVIVSKPVFFGNKKIKGRALAGRIGCAIAAKLLKEQHQNSLEVIFSTQRELQARGLQTALTHCDAKTAILIDGCDSEKALVVSTNSTLSLVKKIESLAEDNDIPMARQSMEKGMDFVLKKSGRMEKILCMGIPIINDHSAAEIADLNDVEHLYKLLQLFLNRGI